MMTISRTMNVKKIRFFKKANNKRWFWEIKSRGFVVARCGPKGYSSKQGAQQSLIAVKNALK
jgi:hypothetical protein